VSGNPTGKRRLSDKQLTIQQHLLELRGRVTWSAIVVFICTGVALTFHQVLIEFLLEPARKYPELADYKPVYTELTEYVGTIMKVSIYAGLFMALPFLLYQLVMFISPGLSGKERVYLYTLVPASLFSFLAGSIFGYYVLFPPAIHFLLTFGNDVATPYIRIGSYVGLMVTLLFWMGVVFQMPIVLFFLSKIGIVTTSFLAKNRRIAIVGAFVVGAIITPTFDPINQTLVALPVIVMYELGIWLSWIGTRGRRKAAKLKAASEQGA